MADGKALCPACNMWIDHDKGVFVTHTRTDPPGSPYNGNIWDTAECEGSGLPVRVCRVCGCDDGDCGECIQATGHPCWWVEDDLCSRCRDTLAVLAPQGLSILAYDSVRDLQRAEQLERRTTLLTGIADMVTGESSTSEHGQTEKPSEPRPMEAFQSQVLGVYVPFDSEEEEREKRIRGYRDLGVGPIKNFKVARALPVSEVLIGQDRLELMPGNFSSEAALRCDQCGELLETKRCPACGWESELDEEGE